MVKWMRFPIYVTGYKYVSYHEVYLTYVHIDLDGIQFWNSLLDTKKGMRVCMHLCVHLHVMLQECLESVQPGRNLYCQCKKTWICLRTLEKMKNSPQKVP